MIVMAKETISNDHILIQMYLLCSDQDPILHFLDLKGPQTISSIQGLRFMLKRGGGR